MARARVVFSGMWLLRPALRPIDTPRRDRERKLFSLVRVLMPQPLSSVHFRGEDSKWVIFEVVALKGYYEMTMSCQICVRSKVSDSSISKSNPLEVSEIVVEGLIQMSLI